MKNVLQHIRQSLSLKLSIGFLLAAAIIFCLSLGLLYLQSRYIIRKEATQRTTAVLNTTVERIRRYLNTIEVATNANASLIEKNMQPDSLLEYSRRIILLNRHVVGCSITTEPYFFPQLGRYFSAYSVVKGDSIETVQEEEYEYFEKVWYKTAKALNEACWVEPYNDYNEGTLSNEEIIASYCRPIYQRNDDRHPGDKGTFVGVIATDVSFKKLCESIKDSQPYPHSYYVMLGKEGRLYMHPDTTRLYRETIFTNADPQTHSDLISLGHEMTTGHQGAVTVEVNGKPCLVCYRQIPGSQMSMALVVPDNDILQSYRYLTLIILLLVVAGQAAIVLIGVKAISHAIRPINKLLYQANQIAAGRYDLQISHSAKKDAVGRLQNSFATMQESLRSHISAIRQANDDTLTRNEELAQATQLAQESERQKTEFIQNMTHQVRTPLNIIMGFAQVLRDSSGQVSEDEARSMAGLMTHNAMTLNRMLLMLFDSSDTGLSEEMSDKYQRAWEPCNDMARESIAFTLQHFPEINIKFSTSIADDVSIHTNRLFMMRSLREILYNSAKYSDRQNISLDITETDNSIRFDLKDTGPGLPEEYLHLLFIPFTKVNELSEGLGLGLPLTNRHVSYLGGHLTLDNDYHEGCRIIIDMPKGMQ